MIKSQVTLIYHEREQNALISNHSSSKSINRMLIMFSVLETRQNFLSGNGGNTLKRTL